jgi:hypothetical protein
VEWLPSIVLLIGMATFIVGLVALRPRLPAERGPAALAICLVVVVFALVLTPCFILAFVGCGLREWQ